MILNILNIKTSIVNRLYVLILIQLFDILILFIEWYFQYYYLRLVHQIYGYICLCKIIIVFNKYIFNITYFLKNIHVFKMMRRRILLLSLSYLSCTILSLFYFYFNLVSMCILFLFYFYHQKEIKLFYKIVENKQIITLSFIYIIIVSMGYLFF